MYVTNGNWSPKLDARYAADGFELAPTDFDSRWERYEIGMKVSGPIVRDKAWIVTAYQMTRTLIANAGVELPRDFDAHYLLTKLTFQPSGTIESLRSYSLTPPPSTTSILATGSF